MRKSAKEHHMLPTTIHRKKKAELVPATLRRWPSQPSFVKIKGGLVYATQRDGAQKQVNILHSTT